MARLLGLLLLLACACPARAAEIDDIARAYVKLVLRVAQHETSYLDAYYGPPDWRNEAAARPGTLPGLKQEADRLIAAVTTRRTQGGIHARRRAFLESQLRAVRAKLDMLTGASLSYAQEARALYGVEIGPGELSSLDPVLGRIEALLPGSGDLSERVAAFRARYAVPADRLEAVATAAVRECRRRTLAHLKLPPGENFRIEIVSDKPWAAYNWYKGGGQSLMQFNTRYPLPVDRVLETACHEGYPGHHVHNMLLDSELVRRSGWVEFSIYPLGTPFFFIAEGIGNYAPTLAFPEADRLAFERDILFPLAGIRDADPAAYLTLARELKRLASAGPIIAADYLDGRIDREAAVERIRKYALLSRKEAEASVDLMPHFRSYGINYSLGEIMVRDHIEAAGPSAGARWRAMRKLLSEPVVPADLDARDGYRR